MIDMKEAAKLEEHGLFKLPAEIRAKALARMGITEDEYREKLRQQLKRDAEHEKALANGEQVHGWSTKRENPGWSDDKIVGEVITDDDRTTEQSHATPGQVSQEGAVLIINHPLGGKRVAAHVFDLEGGGIVFLDSGWTDPWTSSHVVHAVEGEFAPIDMGGGEVWWGVTLDNGEEVFIRRHPDNPRQEGSRQEAREGVLCSLPHLKLS